MDEIHDHKEELRSSNDLLAAFQRSEPQVEERESNSITTTCAEPLSDPIDNSLFTKTVVPTCERNRITIEACLSPRKGLPEDVSKMGHDNDTSS